LSCATCARRYEDAAAQLQSTLKMGPNFLLAHFNLVDVYNYQQKYAEAAAMRTRLWNSPQAACGHKGC
jgi:hypothetical protein